MSFRARLSKDEISPDLRSKIAALSDARPVMTAGGTMVVSIAKRSFRDTSLRQVAWPAKTTGEPSNLIDKGMLISSIRVTETTTTTVTVGSDRRYAAIHQLGGVIRAKGKALVFMLGGRKIFAKQVKVPARPFFPFTAAGKLAAFAEGKVGAVMQAAVTKLLREK